MTSLLNDPLPVSSEDPVYSKILSSVNIAARILDTVVHEGWKMVQTYTFTVKIFTIIMLQGCEWYFCSVL